MPGSVRGGTWAFFVPFIIIATLTILNLVIGIFVSTMQEPATMPDPHFPQANLLKLLPRMETDVKDLRLHVERPLR